MVSTNEQRERRTKRKLNRAGTSRKHTPSSSSSFPPPREDERDPWPRNETRRIRIFRNFTNPKTTAKSDECLHRPVNNEWDAYDLPMAPRRPTGVRRASTTQGPLEGPLPAFPDISEIPTSDQGVFQRVVVDALQAIWARVLRCRCSSRGSITASDPAGARPSHQHHQDSDAEGGED
ncbi:hypothetical protein Bca101_067418 [Brassica carinata]